MYFYGKVTFRSLTGKVVINGPVHRGMIKVGRTNRYVSTTIPWTIWTIRGTIIFNGRLDFWMGSYVLVSDGAVLSFGRHPTFCGSNIHIFCYERISIGNNVRLTWDIQIFDTSFHYIRNQEDGSIPCLTKPVCIGDDIWIGNRTTIGKGAVIPSKTVVASYSLVNKDFSYAGPYCLLAGIPAIVKSTQKERLFGREIEAEWDPVYHYSRTHL